MPSSNRRRRHRITADAARGGVSHHRLSHSVHVRTMQHAPRLDAPTLRVRVEPLFAGRHDPPCPSPSAVCRYQAAAASGWRSRSRCAHSRLSSSSPPDGHQAVGASSPQNWRARPAGAQQTVRTAILATALVGRPSLPWREAAWQR